MVYFPVYRVVEHKFKCIITRDKVVLGEAVADSAKNAKNMAATKALRQLGFE